MTEYHFNAFENFNGEVKSIDYRFNTENIDKIVEQFFWFLAASGFHYVQKIAIDDRVVIDIGS